MAHSPIDIQAVFPGLSLVLYGCQPVINRLWRAHPNALGAAADNSRRGIVLSCALAGAATLQH